MHQLTRGRDGKAIHEVGKGLSASSIGCLRDPWGAVDHAGLGHQVGV